MLSNTWFGRLYNGMSEGEFVHSYFHINKLQERVKLCLQCFLFWIELILLAAFYIYKSHLNVKYITKTAIVIRLLSDESTSVCSFKLFCWSMEKQLPGMVDVLEFPSLFQLWMCIAYTCFQWSELYDWLYTT